MVSPIPVVPVSTRSIATSAGWDASPSQIISQHFVNTYLDSWVGRGSVVRVKCLTKKHITTTPAKLRELWPLGL